MKALFLTAIGQTEIREIEKPSIGPEEVLLKIGMVGFCGGDLNGFKGKSSFMYYPRCLDFHRIVEWDYFQTGS